MLLQLGKAAFELLLLGSERLLVRLGLGGKLSGLAVHQFSQLLIFLLLPRQQLGQLLILIELAAGTGELVLEPGYLLLQLVQLGAGIFGDDKGLWFEMFAPLPKKR